MNDIEILLKRGVSPASLTEVGSYTSPRSYGVYKLTYSGNTGKRYRFGNHPVRMTELTRDYGGCEVKSIFLDREDAEQLAKLLNSK